MRRELLQLASDLARRGESFVIATVVSRESAISAQVGDTALITKGGDFHGWLGGSCTGPTVITQARRALRDGKPRLIRLSPDPRKDLRPGLTVFPMTCHSGGTVEIYLQPVLPPPRLLVFGLSPTARALVRLGKAMGYAVEAVDPSADAAAFPEADRVFTDPRPSERRRQPESGPPVFAVVATQGQWDEDATLAALAHDPAYLGVVASGRRFAEIQSLLAGRMTAEEKRALERIKNPAGLDIGARTSEEIALSILAEIVQHRRSAEEQEDEGHTLATPAPSEEARDPVCGMTVTVAMARHRAEWAGRTYLFCCSGCRERFVAEPERYATAVEASR